jgi:hypothetical protein
MPKISALPAMTTADGDDPAPIVDDSAGSTKKITLTKMKEWLQSLAGWISTAMVADAAITPSKLSTGATRATVTTVQATSSTSYVDLATAGPSVTVTIGANGTALIIIAAVGASSSASGFADMSFDISGATTISSTTNGATNNRRWYYLGTNDAKHCYATIFTGLNPGSTTFKAQYRAVITGTATFSAREISVLPL